MKFVDEFRDPEMAHALVRQIRVQLQSIPAHQKPLQIMEVCGGHTHTLFKFGIDQLLPDDIEFVHGPGCPVCVLPRARIDQCIELAEQPGVIFCSFGDALRVPGARGTLVQARARGADVRVIYSPMDALRIAQQAPGKQVILFAIGFETTMPATAQTLLQARRDGVKNFSVFCQHITIMPPLHALLRQPDVRLDGFLLPGHLSMIIGLVPYQPLVDEYAKPSVITGFEPLDMLQALLMLLCQISEGVCRIENQYARVVPVRGNPIALAAMQQVFCVKSECEWRGLGVIPDSGVQIRPGFSEFDAEVRFTPAPACAREPRDSRCGDVLAGRCRPTDCPLFAEECLPERPIGALMVSSEGACAAYYHYRRQQAVREKPEVRCR